MGSRIGRDNDMICQESIQKHEQQSFFLLRLIWKSFVATVLFFGVFFVAMCLTDQLPSFGRFLAFHPVGSSIGLKGAFWILWGIIVFAVAAYYFANWLDKHPKIGWTIAAIIIVFIFGIILLAALQPASKVSLPMNPVMPPPMIQHHDRVLLHLWTPQAKRSGAPVNIVGRARITDLGHDRYLIQLKK